MAKKLVSSSLKEFVASYLVSSGFWDFKKALLHFKDGILLGWPICTLKVNKYKIIYIISISLTPSCES